MNAFKGLSVARIAKRPELLNDAWETAICTAHAARVKITLPWPHKDLSPNARVHWAAKSRIKASTRKWAGMATLADVPRAVRASLANSEGPIPLSVTFHAPDKRKRDWDNCIASMKAGFDGIADALGVDDSRFVPTVCFGEPSKPGRVEVEIGA